MLMVLENKWELQVEVFKELEGRISLFFISLEGKNSCILEVIFQGGLSVFYICCEVFLYFSSWFDSDLRI